MRSPIVTGLTHPLAILTLAVAAIAGLIAAWWLFALGLVLWVVMAINVARDPALRLSHKMQKRAPVAGRFQQYLDRLQRSQVSIFNSVKSAPPQTRRVLRPIQSEVDALVAQAHALCQRMTMMENYRLVRESRTDLQAELQGMDDAIAGAGDPLVRKEYEDARRVLLEQTAKLKLISTDLDRVEAQLSGLANEMDGLAIEVVRLQGMDADAAGQRAATLVTDLQRKSEELKQSERNTVDS